MLLFLLRALLCSLVFVVGSFVLIVLLLMGFGRDDPSAFYTHNIMPPLLKILRVKISIRGQEKLQQHEPCVFVGNHQSFFDGLIYGTIYPSHTLAIGKSGVRYIPLFGWAFVLCGGILINRKKHESALGSMNHAAQEMLARKVSILIFPEGTRSGIRGLLPFKKGAFYLAKSANCSLVPIVIQSYHKNINLKKWNPGVVEVEVLDPISSNADTEELIPLVRNQMLAKLL